MRIGNRDFDMENNRIYVMGILNVTPDSFSDGGRFDKKDAALFAAEEMVKQGADIIDVGGESTRPGAILVSEEEEKERVCSIIEEIKERFDIPVSLDTYKAAVMEAGIRSGADLANDIWGLRYDEFINKRFGESDMAAVVGKAGIPIVAMHNDLCGRSLAERDYTGISEQAKNDVVLRVKEGLLHTIELAEKYGIAKENIILDPGVGFAKTQEENLQTMKGLPEICRMGCEVLLGVSRKSVIGNALNLPVNEREEGTMALSVLGASMGCKFVRVHDVEKNVRALRMYEAVLNS